MLFLESAWNGNNGAWRLHMTKEKRPSAELRALVEWCRAEGIPTVFWNKEDPPNYDVFIETAKLFDQVFTVDADRIPVYHQDLGHDRVALLPFAAQPRLHNPVRRMKRSEEHTSELQSLMRISYAVFCLKTKLRSIKHECTST